MDHVDHVDQSGKNKGFVTGNDGPLVDRSMDQRKICENLRR